MLNTVCHVEVYELDGEELSPARDNPPTLIVRNHWNRERLVVIEAGGAKYTVVATDLHKAITNATNV